MINKKNIDAYKTISEVSLETGIPAHILRFWEKKIDRLKKVKRKNSHRYYNKDDISFVLDVKKLINDEGYTIKGAQNYLNKIKKNNNIEINDTGYRNVLLEIKDEIELLIKNNWFYFNFLSGT